jgi:hypothetical protein
MNLPLRERSRPRQGTVGVLLSACLLLVAVQSAAAQRVQIDFDEFHGHDGTADYIRDVARAYPNITELLEIGQSTMGRPIYVLVISNMSTGTTIDQHVELRNPRREGVDNVTPMKSYNGKPGMWIDGGTHGNEYTGTEVNLYIIDKLVTGYGADDEITQLVDDNAFFFCPMVNPDGVHMSVEEGISQRQNSMLFDDDEDGEVNEDGPDDLNGDGLYTSFRYPDPEGRYVMDDEDSRHMIRLGQNDETDKERYSVVREDRDNDGDGERGEDPIRGIDVNRNFPEGWWRDDDTQGGSGFYAASSVEARVILEFFTNNTNILMVQSFHTSGGFTYRPFARWSDDEIDPKDLSIYDRIMGKKYLELNDQEVPEAWLDAEPEESDDAQFGPPRREAPQRTARPGSGGPPARQASGDQGSRGYEMPPLWQHPYNDSQDRAYGFGIFIDWAYAQFGSYSMTTELWSWQRDTRGVPGFDGEDDRDLFYRSLLAYQDDVYDGEMFVDWTAYNHPELGRGEVGGWVSTFGSNNAIPGETLERISEIHWQFELFKAGLLPKLAITEAEAEVLYTTDNTSQARAVSDGNTVTIRPGRNIGRYKVVKVTATVENTGALATHVARGANLAGNRQDVIWLIGNRDRIKFLQGNAWQRLGVIDGTMDIPGYDPSTAPELSGPGQQFGGPPIDDDNEPQTGNTREVTWLIAVEGDTPLQIVLSSQKGGTSVRNLSIR